jgi:hypothetical protein
MDIIHYWCPLHGIVGSDERDDWSQLDTTACPVRDSTSAVPCGQPLRFVLIAQSHATAD